MQLINFSFNTSTKKMNAILALLRRWLAPLLYPSALPFIAPPLRLAITDALLFISRLYLFPETLWPYYSINPTYELGFTDLRNVVALLWQLFLVFYAFVVFGFLGYVSFFGFLSFLPPHGIVAVAVGIVIILIALYLTTRPLTYMSTKGVPFQNESWLYVNGICCGRTWLALNCEELANMFGRRIVGINNRTYGFVLDILESIIQRCFGYTTDDARHLYAIVQRELRNANNRRVVLIAHSQGAIIASLVVDRLLASETTIDLAKLELYTFASAANHMHGQGDLTHIEHFVNMYDYVAWTGILAYQPAVLPGNRYDGTIFINHGGIGHLLNMHYLSNFNMFVAGGAAAPPRMAAYLNGGGGLGGGPGGGGPGGGGPEGGGPGGGGGGDRG